MYYYLIESLDVSDLIKQLSSLPLAGKFHQAVQSLMLPAYAHIATSVGSVIYRRLLVEVNRTSNLLTALDTVINFDISELTDTDLEQHFKIVDVIDTTGKPAPLATHPVDFDRLIIQVVKYGHEVAVETISHNRFDLHQEMFDALNSIASYTRDVFNVRQDVGILRAAARLKNGDVTVGVWFDEQALRLNCKAAGLPSDWVVEPGSNPYSAFCASIGN